MNIPGNWLIYSVGFLAQLLFSARLVSQWLLSEKSQKVENPTLYWKLSLIASILLFIYGYLRQDLAIMTGQAFVYLIYFRNLQLKDQWKSSNLILKSVVVSSPVILAVFFIFISDLTWKILLKGENITTWLLIFGIVGQIIFNSRFFYQWIYSERHRKSSLPMGFWVFSLLGSSFVYVYGIFRKDPVLISAHFFGAIIFARNIYLLKRSKS